MAQQQEKRPDAQTGKEAGEKASGERSYGWILPVGILAAIAGVALAYFFGLIGDAVVAMLAVVLFAGVMAALMVRAGFENASGAVRAASLACAAVAAVAMVYQASTVLMPGKPTATGQLREQGSTLTLPSAGSYRLLVSAQLPSGGEPRIEYRIGGGAGSIQGAVERTFGTMRARRGPAMRVAQDHNVATSELTVTGEPAVLKLEALSGEGSKGGVMVRAFKVLSPTLLWSLLGLLLVVATVLEGRLRRSQSTLVASAVASAIFVACLEWANPQSAIGPVLGAALLGAGGGALGGSILGMIGTKLFGPRQAAEPDKADDEKPSVKREQKRKEA